MGKMSIQCIYMSVSTRVHKCLRRPCMPEYGSEPRTLHIYVCVCIYYACERCLSMELSVMKIVEVDLIVVWIFYSFNSVFVSSYIYKMFWKLIGLLSSYHNNGRQPHFCETGTVSPNVACLSTFIACNVHAITFPFRQSWQRFLSIAWLCQAIFYLNSLLFRFWCVVRARWLHTMHYILPPYNGPQLGHWE